MTPPDLMLAPPLDPEVAAAIGATPRPAPLTEHNLAERREWFPREITLPLSASIDRRDHETAPNGPIVRVHRPIDADRPLPCLYWMHSGGFVLGNRLVDELRFDAWCQRHRMVGVVVEYRLAPETPHPGPLDDCEAGLQWTADHADELGLDPGRIGVGGASAGGGLAAALALRARDRDSVPIAFQLLMYAALDDRAVTASSRAELPIWTADENAFAWRAYLGGADADEYAAPARAVDLRGLPPSYVSVGTLDRFVDENVDYASRLIHAGVRTDLRVWAGLPHAFDAIAPQAAASRRAQRDLDGWLEHVFDD